MNVQELEQIRKKYALITRLLFIVWLVAFVLSIINFLAWDGSPLAFVLVWLVGLTILFLVYFKLFKKYENLFKETFARKILEESFEDVTFDPNRGISEADFAANGIFRQWDNYSSSNYVSGKYKGVFFEQSDVNAEVETTSSDSNGNSSTSHTPVFFGRWLIFDYNKSFRSTVKVLEKYFGDSFVYGFTSSFGYEKISMENQAFNAKFHTLSTSEQDAFYLLTPQIMETLLKLEAAEKGRIVFFFKGNRLQIGLNNMKDSFSVGFFGIFKKINEKEIHEKMFRDVRVIMDFADSLQLNNDLFKNNSSDN